MGDVTEQISRAAQDAVRTSVARGKGSLDYSEGSLTMAEELLAEAAVWIAELTPGQLSTLIQNFGCYVLEVGRWEFGGRYYWHDNRSQPVLVVGEPDFRVAILAWDRVRCRLHGDASNNIPFFYAGFAARARQAAPGVDVLYV